MQQICLKTLFNFVGEFWKQVCRVHNKGWYLLGNGQQLVGWVYVCPNIKSIDNSSEKQLLEDGECSWWILTDATEVRKELASLPEELCQLSVECCQLIPGPLRHPSHLSGHANAETLCGIPHNQIDSDTTTLWIFMDTVTKYLFANTKLIWE